MKLDISLDLDNLWTGAEWDETLGEMLREEIRSVIKAEMKKSVKEWAGLKKVIKEYKQRAIQEAMDNIGIS